MVDLAVALRLTAENLMTPELQRALAVLTEVKAATEGLNTASPFGTANITGEFTAMAAAGEAAGAKTAAGAREASAALAEEHGAFAKLKESWIGGTAEMLGGLVAFEAGMTVFDKTIEAAREAEVANRQLGARFGTSAKEYAEFSEAAAQGTNFTAIAFERAASALQPLTRDYSLSNEQLQDLIRTSADLAAANGVGLVQAANDVAASMRGQARAGVELGLNLRSNVIQGMIELTDAEKAAALGGDTLAGAQARLKVINIEAAGSMGAAAQAAGAGGDTFARLDATTAKLFERLADGSKPAFDALAGEFDKLNADLDKNADNWRAWGGIVGGALGFIGGQAEQTAGTPGRLNENILAELEILDALLNGDPTTRAGGRSVGWWALPDAVQVPSSSAAMFGPSGQVAPWGSRSGGVPPQGWRTFTYGSGGQAASIEAAQQSAETQAYLAQLEALDRAGDAFSRHRDGIRGLEDAWGDAAISMSHYEDELQKIGKEQGLDSGLLGDLVAARALMYRMGIYGGQYDQDILGLRVRGNRLTLQAGEAADQRVRAGVASEALGGSFYDPSQRLNVSTMHAQIGTLVVNGDSMSDISGGGAPSRPAPTVPDRYDLARAGLPWAWAPHVARALG